jgi:hypothetical protein
MNLEKISLIKVLGKFHRVCEKRVEKGISNIEVKKTSTSFRYSIFRVRYSVFLFLLLNSFSVNAQWSDTLKEILHGKMFPTASLDGRNSFISSQRAAIWGIKAGVEFAGKLQIGIGYNKHVKNLEKEIYFRNVFGMPDSAVGTLRLSYVSIYTRYVYYKTAHWKFSIMPVQLGLGNSKYKYDYFSAERIVDKKVVVLYEPSISISYKIIPWFGVGADLGYRIMLRGNPAIAENFNSPIYSFYMIIYWGELYKMAFPKTTLAKIL